MAQLPREYAIDHIVLEVSDANRSVEFYRDVLGLPSVRAEEFQRGEVKFPSARVGQTALIDFFPRPMWRAVHAINPNHFALTTTSAGLAAVREQLAARRIAITSADDDNFGARGFGRSIYFDDPDGNSVEVRTYEPS